MPNIEDKKPAMSDQQIILSALGYRVAFAEGDGDYDSSLYLYKPHPSELSSQDIPTSELSEDEVAKVYEGEEIDANFCFREIVPFMRDAGYSFELRATLGTDLIHAWFLPEDPDGRNISNVGPTVEAAIQQAFINYCKKQHA